MKISRGKVSVAVVIASVLACGVPASAQAKRDPAAPPDLFGVYQVIDERAATPDGHRNLGSPAAIPLLPSAAQKIKAIDLKQDPAKMCQPIGPFRMMARDRNKIEIMPTHDMIVMLFEDVSRGLLRTIYTNRDHAKNTEATWQGDSIGRWEGDTLIVDTTAFNDRTWLNEKGAQHSDALHLIERIRPIFKGKYLEYKVTAEDPKVLEKPYTYTRYYEKVTSEVMEDYCEDEE